MAAVGSSSLLCLQGLPGPFWVHLFCPSMDSCWVRLLTDRFCCPVYVMLDNLVSRSTHCSTVANKYRMLS